MQNRTLLKLSWLFFFSCLILASCSQKEEENEDETGAGGITPTTEGSTPAPDITSNENSPLGTNIYNFGYFRSGEWYFIDAMLKSSRWFPINSSGFDQGDFSTDEYGWPNGVSGTATELIKFFYQQIDGHYPAGTYVLLWDGADPTWEIGDDGSGLRCDSGATMGTCTSGRALFDVEPSAAGFSVGLQTAAINSDDYPRNVRILVPGGICGRSATDLDHTQACESSRGGTGTCDAGETCFDYEDVYWNRFSDSTDSLHAGEKVLFHPLTLKRLSPYQAIRTMDPLGINFGNEVVSWDNRGKLSDDSFGHDEKGCPPEVLLALGNVLGTDLWLNIPHQANEAYVRSFAELALEQLQADRTIYLEYTNEHWNTAEEYPQSQYMLTQADSLGIGSGQSESNRRSLYYAQRATEIFKIWREVFAANPTRVQRVLGAMLAQPSLTQLMLEYSDVADNVDHVALGYYLGLYLIFDHFEQLESMNLDSLFAELLNGGLATGEAAGGAVAEVESFHVQQKAITDTFNKPLVAYEGGQHFWYNTTEDNEAISNLFEAANRDIRMETLYSNMFTTWKDTGGELFMHFYNVGPYHPLTGNFGAMEHQDADPNDYPKMRAILKFIDENPRWW